MRDGYSDNENIDLGQFHGTNNFLLRRKAKGIMEKISRSQDPVSGVEAILDQVSKAYSVDNKYLHIQADVILQTMFEYLRAGKIKGMNEADSMSFMRQTSAAISRVKEAKSQRSKNKRDSMVEDAKDKLVNMTSPFIPSPRTLMNAIKIQNPMLGAVIDTTSNLFRGGGDNDKNEKLFDRGIEKVEDQKSDTSSFEGVLNSSSNEMMDVMNEQLVVMTKLYDLTRKVWGDNNDALEDIRDASDEQVERLRGIDEENKRQSFETAERLRESEDDSVSFDGGKKNNKLKDEDGDFVVPFFGAGIGASVATLGSMLMKGGRFLAKVPVIGALITGAFAMFDTFDKDKNLKNFGKADLDVHEMVSAFFANFIGSFVDLIDMLLGTSFGPKVKKKLFDAFNVITEVFVQPFTKIRDSIVSFLNDPTLGGFVDMIKSMLNHLILTPFKLIDKLFGTDFVDSITFAYDTIMKVFTVTIPHFFTETIPDFFTKTIPNFFIDMFEIAKEALLDFISNSLGIDIGAVTDRIRTITDGVFGGIDTFVEGAGNIMDSIGAYHSSRREDFVPNPRRRSPQQLRKDDDDKKGDTNITNIQSSNVKNESITRREVRQPWNNEKYLDYAKMN